MGASVYDPLRRLPRWPEVRRFRLSIIDLSDTTTMPGPLTSVMVSHSAQVGSEITPVDARSPALELMACLCHLLRS